jgi:hypothetical protein
VDDLSALLAQVVESGWRVNNLFQFNDGKWRCNLRFQTQNRGGDTITHYHEFADADTPVEAVQSAIWNMQQRRNDTTRGVSALTESTRLCMKRNEVARQQLGHAVKGWRP